MVSERSKRIIKKALATGSFRGTKGTRLKIRGKTVARGGVKRAPSVTFKDISGRTVRIELGGKTAEQVIKERNQGIVDVAQKSRAQEKLGAIRKKLINSRTGEVTFVGFSGKRITFPRSGLTFTGRDKFGGIISKESADTQRIRRQLERAGRQTIKGVVGKITKEEQERRRQAKVFFGRIPKREAKVKRFKDLTPTGKFRVTRGETTVEKLARLKLSVGERPRKFKNFGQLAASVGKEFILGVGEFGGKFIVGSTNLFKASRLTARERGNFVKATKDLAKLSKQLKGLRGKNITRSDKEKLQKKIVQLKLSRTRLLSSKNLEKANKLYRSEEAKLATSLAGFTVVGAAAGVAGGAAALITKVGLGAVGLTATGAQGLETIKKPTPRNFGKLVFFAAPTAFGILKVIRKLSPTFRPTVKNVVTMKNALLKKNREISKALRGKKPRGILERLRIRRLKRQQTLVNQGLRELRWINNNPQIIKARDYNPLVHTKILNKLQGSYRTSIHVSSEPQAGKLFGQKVTKRITKKELLKKAGKELKKGVVAKEVKPLGLPLTRQRKLSTLILGFTKKRKLALTGSFAQNLFIKKARFRRKPGDIDIKAFNPAKEARIFARLLKQQFKGQVTIKKLPKATRVLLNGKGVLDISKLTKGTKLVSLKGFNILSKQELALKKLTESKPFRQLKDVKDIVRITQGKLRVKDILVKKKNPSNTFEVVDTPGLGKSRMAFDENHMYFDFEAAVAYSKGKPFSIIKFPKVKISKFPARLRTSIRKSAAGQLSLPQAIRLRKLLNAHIKANPNKFFIGPRTGSMPIGEREIVLSVISKFIKRDTYKTFDNDLRRFVSIFEVGFRKKKAASLASKFIQGWKRRPFTTLKLRLTNPDMLQVRRISNLVRRDLATKSLLEKFLSLFSKLFKSKKSKLIKGKKVKAKVKLTKLQKELIRRRKIKGGRAVKKVKAKVKLTKLQKELIRRRKIKGRRAVKKVKKRIPIRKVSRVRKPTPRRRVPTRVKVRPKVRLTTRVPSRAPIRVPKRIVPINRIITRIPKRTLQRIPTRILSRLPTRIPSRITTKKQIIRITKVTKKQLKDKLKPDEAKIALKAIEKRRFIFVADMFSLIFGIRATKRTRPELLKKGRIFLGTERRAIT